jgi:tryptophan synthase
VQQLEPLVSSGLRANLAGVPFTDPLADGPTIQYANQVVLEAGINSIPHVLDFIRTARSRGLVVPLVLMGYFNPFYIYGEEKTVKDVAEAGADGFILVDLPPEECDRFRNICRSNGWVSRPNVASRGPSQWAMC